MLVDAPFAEILREWQWSSPAATTALFYVLAAVSVALVAVGRCRRRLGVFELLVLGVTLLGAVQAVRGVIWFALAAAAILPVALDGLFDARRPGRAAGEPRHLGRRRSPGLAVALVVTLVRPASWFTSEWPERRVEAVRDGDARSRRRALWATDGTADWLLWRIPDLRGRLAFDVRFELYDEAALDDLVAYGKRTPGWQRIVDDYDVIVVDDRAHLARADRPRARAVVPRPHDRRPERPGAPARARGAGSRGRR